MDDSLFSAMRIVALMLRAHGVVDRNQAAWFLWLERSYELNAEQRRLLHDDLHGKHPPSAEEIFAHVTRPEDRSQLLRWLRATIRADGVMPPIEAEVLKRLEVAEQTELHSDYRALAKGILDADREAQVWRELEEAGRFFSERINRWWGLRTQTDLRIVRGLLSKNRFIVWTMVAFLIVLVLSETLFRVTQR